MMNKFQDRKLLENIGKKINTLVKHNINLMEVCGTHTMAIAQYGLRSMFPKNLKMLSGPGCPVCVISQEDVNTMVKLSMLPDVIITTFGDMLHVPAFDKNGRSISLERARADGADVRVIYSPLDSLKIALKESDKKTIFLGVGFETTIPTVASTIILAEKRKITNFFVYPCFKLVPPALRAVLSNKNVKIDGFLLPGHVSTVIGIKPYQFIAKKFGIPCVIAGFEPLDIIQGIIMLLKQLEHNVASVEIGYTRAVKPDGNTVAYKIINKVFDVSDITWRVLGVIPNSGLEFKQKYLKYDAQNIFGIKTKFYVSEDKGCICGKVITGCSLPNECKNFGTRCNPGNPLGPCMVSSEGACAAYYKYREN